MLQMEAGSRYIEKIKINFRGKIALSAPPVSRRSLRARPRDWEHCSCSTSSSYSRHARIKTDSDPAVSGVLIRRRKGLQNLIQNVVQGVEKQARLGLA